VTAAAAADLCADGRKRAVSNESLIRIMCPNLSCQRILAVPEQARGRIVRCRVCGMNIRIPQAKTPGEAPAKAPAAENEDKKAAGKAGQS
jgi:hypothetical protein